MDGMPGGSRANRVTRASGATLAAVTGEEYHTLSLAEMASHGHPVSDPTHAHAVYDPGHIHGLQLDSGTSDGSFNIAVDRGQAPFHDVFGTYDYSQMENRATGIGIYGAGTGISVAAAGGGGAHENLPTATFVPYIVKLDD
jgi:microcystin-dependent protein